MRIASFLPAAMWMVMLAPTVARADDDERHVLPCRPTVACTADLAPPGTLELEVGDQARRANGANDDAAVVLVKLPVASWLELQVGDVADTSGSVSTAADAATVGAKLHVADQTASRPSLAITATASYGADRAYDVTVVGHASKDLGSLHVDANAGVTAFALSAATAYQPFAAIAASYPVTARLGATLEPHAFGDASPAAPHDLGAIAALAYTARPWLVIDGALDVTASSPSAIAALVGVSVAPVRLWGAR